MYEEDFIFGPLTLKQFFCVATGVGAGFIIEKIGLPENIRYLAYGIIAFLIIVSIIRFKPKKIPTEHVDVYFQNKRVKLGEDNFKRFINKKVAEVSSQISMREERGLPDDPKLQEALLILQKAINTQSKNP